jgi:transcriptional regulator with XRE-family HTH domain
LTKGREEFGKRVARARAQKGWTLADLGKAVGVSGTCVWNWEEGNTHPRPGSLVRLAAAFGISTEHLLEGQQVADAVSANDGSDAPGGDVFVSLADLINRSREAIAQAAGLPSLKVRITLDYGD